MAVQQGWYPDPEAPGNLRWWDGEAWTDFKAAPTQTTPPAGVPPYGAPPGQVSYGPPAQQWPPYGAPPSPRRKVWPWVVGAFAIFVVLVGVAAAIIVPRIIDAVTAPVDAANVYLHGAQLGGTPVSYDRLCARLKSQYTYDEFQQELANRIQRYGHLVSYDANGTHRDFGQSQATVDVDVVTSYNGRGQIEAFMTKEGGRWTWCGWGPGPGSDVTLLPLI